MRAGGGLRVRVGGIYHSVEDVFSMDGEDDGAEDDNAI